MSRWMSSVDLVKVWHWTEGNGAMPFPGRRVEFSYPSEFISGVVYEVREYLGNDMVVSYREVFPDGLRIPESMRWAIMRERFDEYLGGPRA